MEVMEDGSGWCARGEERDEIFGTKRRKRMAGFKVSDQEVRS